MPYKNSFYVLLFSIFVSLFSACSLEQNSLQGDITQETINQEGIQENTSSESEEQEESEEKTIKQNEEAIEKIVQPDWGMGVKVETTTDYRIISSTGIPSHATGDFPMMQDSNLDGRPDNPNSLEEQDYTYKIPLVPEESASTTELPMGPIAIALSGAVFFNPQSAEGTDATETEVFDSCQGHPEMHGRYHYHQLSDCFIIGNEGHSFLIGYAFDGFGIYGPYEDTDEKPLDLDICNGHKNEELGYHYHTTEEFPYLLGCYHGVVEESNFDTRGK